MTINTFQPLTPRQRALLTELAKLRGIDLAIVPDIIDRLSMDDASALITRWRSDPFGQKAESKEASDG